MTAQMLLPLAPGNHRVEIRFRRTWDRTAGDAHFAFFLAIGLAGVCAVNLAADGEDCSLRIAAGA